MEGKGELEVSEAKLLYCVTVGGAWGEGKGRICLSVHAHACTNSDDIKSDMIERQNERKTDK